jgi:hypothetical protein
MNQYEVTVTFKTIVGHNDPVSAIDEACTIVREEFGGSRDGLTITEVRSRLIAEGEKQ